jgi:VCBS repeat protein/type IX secretion system substrate protein
MTDPWSLLLTPLGILALGTSVNGDPLFGPRTDFPTGAGPASVVIGDLNNDGKPDLITANNGANTVSVLLGNGDGTFGSKADYDVGWGIFSVTIGDLNDDGNLDAAAALFGGWPGHGSVSVLLGNGDGTFGPPTYFLTGNAAFVAIGDLNNDGKPDLAAATSVGSFGNGGVVSVLLGNGDGSFGAATDFPTGGPAYAVAIGDLNADGNPDLVLANLSPGQDSGYGSVSVLLGNGDGSFGATTDYPQGFEPRSVAIADLNADARLDLAVGDLVSPTVSVLLGNGDGSFGAATGFVVGGPGHSVAIGDLNGDGKPDVAATNYASNTVSLLLGIGDGSFATKSDYFTERAPLAIAIGDLNDDGKPDLAVANHRSNTVSVLLNIGPPTCPLVPMGFDLTPHTLNLRSRGQWVTVTLEPEPPALPADIDIASIQLNSNVSVDPSAPTSIGDVDGNGRADLTVKFSRSAVGLTLMDGDAVPVTVSGRIGNSCFEETELIRVNHVRVAGPSAGSAREIATPRFALKGVFPNPAQGALTVTFSLQDGPPASLELYDVSGRRVLAREVGGLGPGVHSVALEASGSLPSGVYMIRLTQGGRSLTTRAVLTQ